MTKSKSVAGAQAPDITTRPPRPDRPHRCAIVVPYEIASDDLKQALDLVPENERQIQFNHPLQPMIEARRVFELIEIVGDEWVEWDEWERWPERVKRAEEAAKAEATAKAEEIAKLRSRLHELEGEEAAQPEATEDGQ
jgi:hypothetical protein